MNNANKIEKASVLIKNNLFLEAKKLLRSVVLKDSCQVDALYLLALAESNLNNLAGANAYLSRALVLNPLHYDALYLRALILQKLDDHLTALDYYSKLLNEYPNNFWCYINRGNSYSALKNYASALVDYTKAISLCPESPAGFCNRANLLQDLKRYADALGDYDRAIELDVKETAIWNNRGNVLKGMKRYADALLSYDNAIFLNPGNLEALLNKGIVLGELDRHDEALKIYDQAIKSKPDYAEAWLNRGNTLSKLKRNEEALSSFDRTISLKPDHWEAWNNRGVVLNDLLRHYEALDSCDRSIKCKPESPEAWGTRGVTLQELGRYDEALTSYEQSIRFRPDYADARYNSALLYLKIKNFKDGFENYAWRWEIKHDITQPLLTTRVPRCTPELLEGRIFLWAEQGLGDEVFYAGLFQNAIDSSRKLTVSADRRLHTIFERSFPSVSFVDRVHSKTEAFDDGFDSQAPIGDLAYLLKLGKDDIKRSRRPFLLPDGNRVLDIKRNQHPFVDNQVVCGVSWRSNNRFFGEAKSIKLEELRALFEKPNLSFVNLQYGEVGAEIQDFERRLGAKFHQINNLDLYNDIEGLTALIAACDVVVTTSSITAHLAGAIGKRGCVLIPFSKGKIWYWHLNDEFSFWYPSLKVFYQDHPSDWSNTIFQASEWLAGISPTPKNELIA